MKLNFKKRKAETLAESVVAIAVFGILLLGLTDFMSSQINYVARLKHRDKIISKAQMLVADSAFFTKMKVNPISDDYEWKEDYGVLTVKDGKEGKGLVISLDFALP